MQRFNEQESVQDVRQSRNRQAAQRPALSLEVEVLEARIAPAYFGGGLSLGGFGRPQIAICCE